MQFWTLDEIQDHAMARAGKTQRMRLSWRSPQPTMRPCIVVGAQIRLEAWVQETPEGRRAGGPALRPKDRGEREIRTP